MDQFLNTIRGTNSCIRPGTMGRKWEHPLFDKMAPHSRGEIFQSSLSLVRWWNIEQTMCFRIEARWHLSMTLSLPLERLCSFTQQETGFVLESVVLVCGTSYLGVSPIAIFENFFETFDTDVVCDCCETKRLVARGE